jgi:hypothetical protein
LKWQAGDHLRQRTKLREVLGKSNGALADEFDVSDRRTGKGGGRGAGGKGGEVEFKQMARVTEKRHLLPSSTLLLPPKLPL